MNNSTSTESTAKTGLAVFVMAIAIAVALIFTLQLFLKGTDPVGAVEEMIALLYSPSGFKFLHSFLLAYGILLLAFKLPVISRMMQTKDPSGNVRKIVIGSFVCTLIAEVGGGLYTNFTVSFFVLIVALAVAAVGMIIGAAVKQKIRLVITSPFELVRMKIQVKSISQILFVALITVMTACSIYFFNSFGKFDRPTTEITQFFYGVLTLIMFACTFIVAGVMQGNLEEIESEKDRSFAKSVIAILSSFIAIIFLACVLVALF